MKDYNVTVPVEDDRMYKSDEFLPVFRQDGVAYGNVAAPSVTMPQGIP